MKEKDLTCMFRNWLKANWKSSAAFELKMCKLNTFALSQIADHQLSNLRMINEGLFSYKIPDLGLQNPMDCFTLYKAEAYIVIFFYKPRQPKKFYMIPIVSIIGLLDDNIKSLSEPRAAELAEVVGEIN